MPTPPPHSPAAPSRENQLASLKLTVSNVNSFTHFADGDTYHPTWIEDDLSKRNTRIAHTIACVDLPPSLALRR